MDIVGRGFIAHHLGAIAARHPDTVAYAAGVSGTAESGSDAYARDDHRLDRTISDCVRTGRRLLFFSSASAAFYGSTVAPATEAQPAPLNVYGWHKLAAEGRIRASGAAWLILRLGHVVGAGAPPHQLVPTLTRHIRDGEVGVHRGATRDLIGVTDTVTIIDHLLRRDVHGETVTVASGVPMAIDAIVDRLEQNLGVVVRRRYIDGGTTNTLSIDKLRRLVPETERYGFGPAYHRRLLDTYVRSELTRA